MSADAMVKHEHYGRGSPFSIATQDSVVRVFRRSGVNFVAVARYVSWVWQDGDADPTDIVAYEIIGASGNGEVITPFLMGGIRPAGCRVRVYHASGIVEDGHASTVRWETAVAFVTLPEAVRNPDTDDSPTAQHQAEQDTEDRRGTVDTREYSGAKTSYYELEIRHPTRDGRKPYTAECNDIIEAAGMTFAEGEAFKALWRGAVARLGLSKRGYTDGLYDAQKVAFYGGRMVVQQQAARESDNPF